MAINMKKGQKLDLTKDRPNLTKVLVGLGWDVQAFDGAKAFDLDASAFLIDNTGKCPSEADCVFYNQPVHASGSVKSLGDNRTGSGEGDDEQVEVDLSKVPANIDKIAFTITIYEAEERNQNFGMVTNSYVHIQDAVTGEDLVRFDLGEDFSIETAIVVGELYRHNGGWKFNAVGAGFQGGLPALCHHYGLETE